MSESVIQPSRIPYYRPVSSVILAGLKELDCLGNVVGTAVGKIITIDTRQNNIVQAPPKMQKKNEE